MPQDYYPSGPFLGQLPDRGAFDSLREDFLLGFERPTARAYKADLEAYWEWCTAERLDPTAHSSTQIAKFGRALGCQGYSAGTMGRRMAAVRGFIDYISA